MNIPTKDFGPPDIARWFSPQKIRDAKPYGHSIRNLVIREAEITAQVQFTINHPYLVRIAFFQERNISLIDATCTCDVAYFCKHCVAVLVAALAQRNLAPNAPARPSKEILDWAETTLQQLQIKPTEKIRAQSADALHYVIPPFIQTKDASLAILKGHISQDRTRGAYWNNIDRALLDPPSFVNEDDLAILRTLRSQMRIQGKQELSMIGMSQTLPRILATGRAWFVESTGRNVTPADWHCLPLRTGLPRQAILEWHRDERGNTRAGLRAEPQVTYVLPTSPLWYVDEATGEAGPLDCGENATLLRRLLELPELRDVDLAVILGLLSEVAPDLPKPADSDALSVIAGPPVPILKLDSLTVISYDTYYVGSELRSKHTNRILDYARLVFRYGQGESQVECVPGDKKHYINLPHGRMARIARDLALEDARQGELDNLGFLPMPSQIYGEPWDGKLALESEALWQRFFADLAPKLIATGWRLEYPPTFRHHFQEAEGWEAEMEEEGNGWFKLDLGVLVAGQRLSLAPLLTDLFRREPRWLDAKRLQDIPPEETVMLNTPGGDRIRVDAARIKPLASTLIDLFDALPASGEVRVSLLDGQRLDFLSDQSRWQFKGDDEVLRMARRLREARGIQPVAPPAGFTLELRPYQREGLAWLQFLREQNLAGILADDMGLGKTAQTLAHILTEKQAGRLDRPALVVLPTSLIFNWKREAQRCAPDLRVLSLHGPNRADAFPQIPQHDVCLTTYPLLWRDEEALARHRYSLLILDEAQTVKNANARASGVVRRLEARHRLCLTGTPMENHLGELWAQFDFLLPGFLGDQKQFTNTWRSPIEKRGDRLRRDLLARRIAPFILRRKKEDVASELPEKTIIVRSVELIGGQRDLYETVRAAMDAKVREEIASKGFNRSQIVILDALLKLRQVCCDPRLLKTVKAAAKVKEHAKLELLMDMLPELVAEGRRVLVFSQFTSMLALIAEALDLASIGYVTLTGNTQDRETVVGRFQDGAVPVFLISLKAGGVGLNLTAADTVIHFDPWWNPAAENQATDRAHRIGQKNKVFVYKLVAAGSIEERIVILQEKKAALAAGVLSEDGAAMTKFGEEDLRALLAPLPGK